MKRRSHVIVVSYPVRPPFPGTETTESDPLTLLECAERTQDSANISYGVEVDGWRYFVKTAGRFDNSKPYFDHSERVCSLRNALRIAESSSHRALPKFHEVIESPTGPMLAYDNPLSLDGRGLG